MGNNMGKYNNSSCNGSNSARGPKQVPRPQGPIYSPIPTCRWDGSGHLVRNSWMRAGRVVTSPLWIRPARMRVSRSDTRGAPRPPPADPAPAPPAPPMPPPPTLLRLTPPPMEPAPAALTLWCRNTAGRPAAGEGAVAPVTAGQVQGEGEGEEGMKQFEGKAPRTKQNNKEGGGGRPPASEAPTLAAIPAIVLADTRPLDSCRGFLCTTAGATWVEKVGRARCAAKRHSQ